MLNLAMNLLALFFRFIRGLIGAIEAGVLALLRITRRLLSLAGA